jgi:hypothetical protein
MKERFPIENNDFDHVTFLKEATFKVWSSPVEHVIQKEISNEEKLELLTQLESDLNRMLEKIQKEKKKLITNQNE